MNEKYSILRSKRFLPLFITQFLGAFNDNAFKNAFLIWFTYDVATRSDWNAATMVTIAAGLFILPFFIFSATAGELADKYEQAWLAQKIKQIEIILMLASAICFWLESIYGLLVVLFMMGVQSTFFGPIKYSLLPEHLKEDELIIGNGMIEGATFLSILLGTMFGGLIILTQYGTELLSIFVIIFAVLGWLSSRSIPLARIKDPELNISWNIVSGTWKIIQFARIERTVWLSILGISWFWLIGAVFVSQFPTYTKDVVQGNEHIVTLFLTVFSVGVGIGSMWCNRLLKGEINGRLVPYGSIGITVGIMLFVASSYFYQTQHIAYVSQMLGNNYGVLGFTEFFSVGVSSWLIVFSLLLLSVFAGIYIVPLYAIMQHRSSELYLARVIAAANVMGALFMVASSLIVLGLFLIDFSMIEIFFVTGLINIPAYFIVNGIVKRRLKNA